MNSTEFEELVVEALESLPSAFVPYLENVEILVEPRLTRQIRQRLELEPGEVVYGFYEGVPLTEQGSDGVYLPATILIFQEPLERDFSSRLELRQEVRRTVLHELAHHLGISDERLDELGAY